MKKRVLFATICLCATIAVAISAQRPADAPATAASGKPPDSVFIEDLTWAEVRDLIAGGTTSVIVGTAGTEQKGPHMIDGEHKFVMEWSADKIARGMGKTLVAPVVTYVPEGSWENIGGHMAKPGTITLPEDRFVDLLVNAGKSLKAGGFKKIWFIGESGGNRTGMRSAAEKLNALWNGAATAYWVDDYYTKAHAEQNTWAAKFLKVADDQVGNHANILDTSELLFVAPKHIRRDRLTGNDYPNNGVSGNNQSKSTPEVGKALLQIKLDLALAQIKRMNAGSEPPVAAAQAPQVRRPWRPGRRQPSAEHRVTRTDHEHRAGQHDADESAGHRVHRRADVGRKPRCDESRQDRVHRAHRRDREERLPHGDGQT